MQICDCKPFSYLSRHNRKRLSLDSLASPNILRRVATTTTTNSLGEQRGSTPHLPAYRLLMHKLGASGWAPRLGCSRLSLP